LIKYFILPIFLANILSCASDPHAPIPVQLKVIADYRANGGKLFYAMVTSTNEQQFMIDGYSDIAAKAFAEPPDQNTLKVFLVQPGSEQEITFDQPAQGLVGLYFLFTDPGVEWKKLLNVPLGDGYEVNFSGGSNVSVVAN
jgi:hypothetical protein